MKLVALFLFVAWSSYTICAQEITVPNKTDKGTSKVSAQQAEQLQLRTRLVGLQHVNDHHLKVNLLLTFTNLGSQPVILYKYSITIPRYMISRNIKEAAAKKYIEDMSLMIKPILPGPLDVPLPDKGSVFVILRPGETYTPEIETTVDLLDTSGGTNINKHLLRPGGYIMEVIVRTWYGSQELASKLSERWRQYGFLWSKSVKSQPMPYRIEK